MKVRAFKLKNPGNVRQSNRRRTVYSRERCTEQSVVVRARQRREKEERERRGLDDDPRSQSRSSSVSILEDLDLKAQKFADLICSENTHTALHGLY